MQRPLFGREFSVGADFATFVFQRDYLYKAIFSNVLPEVMFEYAIGAETGRSELFLLCLQFYKLLVTNYKLLPIWLHA